MTGRVIVIGAGLAGLALAVRLREAGRDVLLLEAEQRAGGQIHSLREAGLVVEQGAEGFVARSRAVPALCELLGITGSLIDQLTTDTYCLEHERLVLLPAGEAARRLGFQIPEEELGRGIRSLALGMGELIDALVERVGARALWLGAKVRSVAERGAELEVSLESGTLERASQLVIATGARAAERLLAPFGESALAPLAEAPTMSNVSVNLLYRRGQLGDFPAASGVLFPESFGAIGLRACSFVNHKFSGRAGPEQALLRAFFRPTAEALASLPDARWSEQAAEAIREVLHADGEPERAWVRRWPSALPVFSPAYRAAASIADRALRARSIHLAGSAFHGAGIDAAVASAEAVAQRLLESSQPAG